MNNLQKIAAAISGYDNYYDIHACGDQNDYYYDLTNEKDKIEFLISFSKTYTYEKVFEIDCQEAGEIFDFLEGEFEGQGGHQEGLDNLGRKTYQNSKTLFRIIVKSGIDFSWPKQDWVEQKFKLHYLSKALGINIIENEIDMAIRLIGDHYDPDID